LRDPATYLQSIAVNSNFGQTHAALWLLLSMNGSALPVVISAVFGIDSAKLRVNLNAEASRV
jgi:hypothetical protein